MFGATVLQDSLFIVLRKPMKLKSSICAVHRAISRHRPIDDGTKASVYHFYYEFVAFATVNSQQAELSAATLNECSGKLANRYAQKFFPPPRM